MTTVPDNTPRALRIDGALSARAVLDHFNDKGRALLGPGQEDAASRIAQLLAHEAALSDARSGHGRRDAPLPLWWTLPLAVRDRSPQRVTLPMATTREALAA